MAIREDLVASAAKFLQDPNVSTSPIENRVAFLQAKNLTQDEISAALARAESSPQGAAPYSSAVAQQGSYHAQFAPQYPPYAWQQPLPEAPRRDWRDWFIMATVVGGVGYGLYSLGKRYVYPLVAPPTPERLEQDKKHIDEQFERSFALVDQLAKDTEALKAAEQERTARLDTALSELETVISDLKSANRRREDDASRLREDVQALKDSMPRALTAQKDVTDSRLREVNTELKSLKTLISQRMNPNATATSASNYPRPATANDAPKASGSAAAVPENAGVDGPSSSEVPVAARAGAAPAPGTSQGKASIPAWQLALASTGSGSGSMSNGAGGSS